MHQAVTIYHNPRCSKSRAALELLQQRKISPRIVDYLEHPPAPAEIRRILRALELKPRQLMRTGEAVYRDLALDDPALGDDELIAAMHDHPILIQRPIVVAGDAVALGRPPQRVLDIL